MDGHLLVRNDHLSILLASDYKNNQLQTLTLQEISLMIGRIWQNTGIIEITSSYKGFEQDEVRLIEP